MTRKVSVWKKTDLCHGGVRKGLHNVIGEVEPGDYEAFYQCIGDEVTEGPAKNSWWVKIRTDEREGWVSGVFVDIDGDNDALIHDTNGHELPPEPTDFR
jgi:hypothetical protein